MAEDKKIVIMPCKCAPSRQLVQAWLLAKEEYERSKKLSKTEPTGVVKSAEDLSSSVNTDDRPVAKADSWQKAKGRRGQFGTHPQHVRPGWLLTSIFLKGQGQQLYYVPCSLHIIRVISRDHKPGWD